jgi:Ca2+/H+ antiporter
LPQPLLLGVLVAALVAHVGEALHAAKLAQALGSTAVAGWALQTLLLGYPSLRLLLRRRAS